jgi:phospholipid-transporting ATPase
MEFKKMTAGNFAYGIEKGNVTDCVAKDVTNFNFEDPNFNAHLADKNHENNSWIVRYLTHLAVCHTVVSETKNGKTFLNASSPDELALVNAAKYYNYNFLGRDEQNSISVSINGKTEAFVLLNVIEFTSDRKRMTTIVKMPDGTIKVMCKGADSIILERLSNSKQTQALIKPTNEALDSYANTGLRTLLLCEKEISFEQYRTF